MDAIYQYQCTECGKIEEAEGKNVPTCCDKPMEKLPFCTLMETPEQATTGNNDEPCYDYRAGSDKEQKK